MTEYKDRTGRIIQIGDHVLVSMVRVRQINEMPDSRLMYGKVIYINEQNGIVVNVGKAFDEKYDHLYLRDDLHQSDQIIIILDPEIGVMLQLKEWD